MSPQQIKEAKKTIRMQGKLNALEREIFWQGTLHMAQPSPLRRLHISGLMRRYESQYIKVLDRLKDNK